MIGTKRRNVSLRSDAEETANQSKKVVGESPFQSPPVEPSVKVGSALPLDFKRALTSRQHVRALNTQFASWVQSQLLNHPDELWEDGAQDYLAHASRILERFSDVVNWLKVNSANAVSMSSVEALPADKKASPQAKSEGMKTPSAIPIGGPNKFSFGLGSSSQASSPSSTSLFSSPWTSSVFNSQSSLSGTNTSSGLSSSSQASLQSTSLIASGVSSKSHNQSPVSSGNASPWTSSAFNNQFSLLGANASSGLSSSSQASSQSTSLFASGISSKSQSQSPLSGGNFGFGLLSNSQTTPQSTTFSPPWTSTGFSNSSTAPSGPTSGSATSWSFGSSSNNQTQFTFGNQNLAPLDTATADDDNEENEKQPSSPSLKKSEEKGIHVVHEVKCKLYMKSIDPADKDPWKDRGTGQLSIKCKEGENKGTKESKPTIIIRNDVGRILLNALLYSGIKLNMPKSNSIVAIFHTRGDNDSGARTFLIRTRNQEDRDKLAEAIKEHAPSA